MYFAATLDDVSLELFTYWARRDLEKYLRGDPKWEDYERDWLVQIVTESDWRLVGLRAYQLTGSRTIISVTPINDPEHRLAAALCNWLNFRWGVTAHGITVAEGYPGVAQQLAPARNLEELLQRLDGFERGTTSYWQRLTAEIRASRKAHGRHVITVKQLLSAISYSSSTFYQNVDLREDDETPDTFGH